MDRRLTLTGTASVALAALWLALAAVTAPNPATAPDPSSAEAVTALVEAPPREASAAVPDTFAEVVGYAPRVEDGSLVNPTGDCSSPVPLPAEFGTACRSHDLGYDLIRHAHLVGGTLGPEARREVDAGFARDAHASCAARDSALSRAHCHAWADIAAGAVRLNSWRQHDMVPDAESASSLATGTVGVLALGSGSGTLALAGAVARRRLGVLRSALAALPLPRVSTAGAGVLGLFLSISPTHLPHVPLLQGALTALLVGACLGVVAVLRPPVPRLVGRSRRWTVAGVAAVGVLVLLWAQLALGERRTDIGLAAPGVGYWVTVAAVVLGCGALLRGAAWAWARRHRLWRPVVAAGTAVLVLTSTGPVHADDPTPDEALLLESSSEGAVRAYAEIVEGEEVQDRARRVADELVREGGLQRSRIVVAVPTGTGWVNPHLVTGLEERFGSDVATVSMQYDTAPSWVAYLVGRERAEEGAQALFDAVLERVEELPPEDRPDVHVQGESLGATAGQALFTGPGSAAARDAVCSVLWVGSPGGATAGLEREAAVSNADDPVVHASVRDLVVPPGDDDSWLPVVSGVHDAVDFIGALWVPEGTGHVYGEELVDDLATCR